MTEDEFISWKTTDGSVRIDGLDASFVLVKKRGDTDGAIALRLDYELFRESYAHAHSDGPIFRHHTHIADISELELSRD